MADRDPSEAENSVREAVERSRSGAPAVGRVVRDRFSSDEIFQRIIAAADEEITSTTRELFFSGLAAGFAISITFMLYATLTASTDGDPILSAVLYPLGFIYIIIGGYQLYTENTLPPVALTLERLASIPMLLRNWVVVLAGNFIGGMGGAATLAWADVFSPEARAAAFSIAEHGVQTDPWALFFKAVFAGLIVAGVVWAEYAARDTISRLAIVYIAFLAIPLGDLFHVVVSFTEAMFLVFNGAAAFPPVFVGFVLPVLLGNTAGGVVLVTVVNYFQTSEERIESARFEGARRQLSWNEWFLGGIVGRSYVPVIDTTRERETEGPYRVFVPIADPDTAQNVAELAGAIAANKSEGTVMLTHVLPEYDPHSVPRSDRAEVVVSESDAQLAGLRATVEAHDVTCETATVVSHRPFREVFEVAGEDDADLILLKQVEDSPWASDIAERRLNELSTRMPADVLVFQDRGLDMSDVLIPVIDTPHATLSAEIATALREAYDSSITLLHVVDSGERKRGDRFLRNWAIDHDLEDANRIVNDTGNAEAAVGAAVEDHTFVLAGAVESGLLSRLLARSLQLRVISEIDRSVLLAERPTGSGMRNWLFGEN